jgi:hypothetical protein
VWSSRRRNAHSRSCARPHVRAGTFRAVDVGGPFRLRSRQYGASHLTKAVPLVGGFIGGGGDAGPPEGSGASRKRFLPTHLLNRLRRFPSRTWGRQRRYTRVDCARRRTPGDGFSPTVSGSHAEATRAPSPFLDH